MKKIIVYDSGLLYGKSKNEIGRKFEVVAVTSDDEYDRKNYDNYILKTEIKNVVWDNILVYDSQDAEKVNFLINVLEIPKEKILLRRIEFSKRGFFYSQKNEDAVMFLILKLIGIDINSFKGLFYLDLGTNHPIKLNNTYGLYRAGARGILVEPNRDLWNIIQVARPQDTLIRKAVSSKHGKTTFYSMKASTLSTLSIDKLDNDFCKQYDYFTVTETYDVDTITMDELLKGIGKVPDILSIDIEGYDLEVLSGIDYCTVRPKIIISELGAWGLKQQERENIIELLSSNNYILITDNHTNGIFVDGKYEKYVSAYKIF